ncbi:MAG: hypothetical protein HC802_12285, partial [Caldilineaceae bacterium]|nr:hypothetical protein [Caldilineaceae bacterium]
YKTTEWRIGIRRSMNESDNDASSKAVDSLLNFETVKYFGADRRETMRFDGAMAVYERSSTQAYTSLAILNAGQAVIFTIGMTIVMVMCAMGRLAHVKIQPIRIGEDLGRTPWPDGVVGFQVHVAIALGQSLGHGVNDLPFRLIFSVAVTAQNPDQVGFAITFTQETAIGTRRVWRENRICA